MGVVEVIALHISRECAQCSARGFVCEMCEDAKPIFAFDILNVAACRGCNTFVHRRCITQSRSCRRCKRLRDRKMGEAASLSVSSSAAPLGLMSKNESFVSQQTQRMAAQERRRRANSREQDPFSTMPLTYLSSREGQEEDRSNHVERDATRHRGVSAGGPEEAPMLQTNKTTKSWHWRRGSKE